MGGWPLDLPGHQRNIGDAVESNQGAICRSRLLTVTTTLRQQGRYLWFFLEQAWIAQHCGEQGWANF